MNFIKLDETDVPGAKLGKAPRESSVTELKRWLECHGLKKSGLRDDLVKRVEQAMVMTVPVSLGVDGGKWYDSKLNLIRNEKEKGSKITVGDIVAQDTLPVKMTSNATDEGPNWTIFPSINIPELFNEGHIYHFIVEQVSGMALHDDELIDEHETAKPLKKGKELFNSGFVHDVGNAEDRHSYYLQAHVHHSMKGEPPLLASVTLSKMTGFVLKGKCTCRAKNIERCAHVGAILFFLLDYIQKNGHVLKNACTSLPCVWNKGKKRDKNPQKLHKALYSTLKRNPTKLYDFDPRLPQHRGINVEDTNAFLVSSQGEFREGAPSMWETLLEVNYDDFKLTEDEIKVLRNQCAQFEESNRLSILALCGTKTCCQIEGTLEQSQSARWYTARWPLITASDSKAAQSIGEKLINKPYPVSQVVTMVTKKFWSPHESGFKSFDMLYGIENEPDARRKYEMVTGERVVTCGLFVNVNYPFMGASPDGIVMNSEKPVGLIEIKCFKVLRNKSVGDVIKLASTNKNILPACLNMTDGRFVLKQTHAYFFQIQQQLLVTDLEYCDFVLHSPLGPPSIERIFRDRKFQGKLASDVYRFWKNAFLAEYFLMKVPRKLPPYILED